MDPVKKARLRKIFTAFITSQRAVKNAGDAKLFLEAACDQDDRPTCVERLATGPSGLQSVKMSLRSNTSSTFINESVAPFLMYISDDSVRQLGGGQFLHNVLAVVIDPPTFWDSLRSCHKDKSLSPAAVRAFAHLLLELFMVPSIPPEIKIMDRLAP